MPYEAWNAGRMPPGAATTTASTSEPRTFTLDDLKRLERELAAMPQPKWTLIAPDGRAWQDADPQALFRVLAGAVMANWPVGVPGTLPTSTKEQS